MLIIGIDELDDHLPLTRPDDESLADSLAALRAAGCEPEMIINVKNDTLLNVFRIGLNYQ